MDQIACTTLNFMECILLITASRILLSLNSIHLSSFTTTRSLASRGWGRPFLRCCFANRRNVSLFVASVTMPILKLAFAREMAYFSTTVTGYPSFYLRHRMKKLVNGWFTGFQGRGAVVSNFHTLGNFECLSIG